MNVRPYSPIQLPALVGRPSFEATVTADLPFIEVQIAGEAQNKARGLLVGNRAELLRLDASGGGRGTYLTAAFVQESIVQGANWFWTYAVHPGTLAIFGKLFGPNNIDLWVPTERGEGRYEGSYKDGLRHLALRQDNLRPDNTSDYDAITVEASLANADARHHLLGGAMLSGAVHL